MLRKTVLVFCVVSLLAVGSGVRGAPGDLDTTFSGDGRTMVDVGFAVTGESGRHDYAQGVAIQPDGKIVLAGATAVHPANSASADDWAIVRLLRDGTPDATFGEDGIVTTNLGNVYEAAEDLVIQPDGKIVAVGQMHGSPDATVAIRYTSDGELDPGFGDGGIFTHSLPGSDFGHAVALHEDGIVIVGRYDGIGGYDSFVMRLTSDGELDSDPTTGFAEGGVFTSNVGAHDWAHDVAVQDDGMIVVAGTFNWGGSVSGADFYVLRLNANGTPDDDSDGTDFGEAGLATVDWDQRDNYANAVAIDATGRIYAGGSTTPADAPRDMAIAAFTPDGELDPTWSGDGKIVTDFSGLSDDGVYGLAVASDDKLLAASWSNGEAFKVARYLTNGKLDAGFGGDGSVARKASETSGGMARAVATYPNGRIVVAGSATKGGGDDFAVIRLRVDKDPSETTVTVEKGAKKIVARGKVKPNHEGERVVVKLFKKKNGTFKLVEAKGKKLSTQSKYKVAFDRPNANRCMITARFSGDGHHKPSAAADRFGC